MSFIRLVPTYHYRQIFHAGYKLARTHCHESVEVMYMETGRCAFLVGEGEVVLGEGELIFLGSFFPHGMEVRKEACRIINLEFLPAKDEGTVPVPLVDLAEVGTFLHARESFLPSRPRWNGTAKRRSTP